jgi:predicted ArsR family transcriptional regulator
MTDEIHDPHQNQPDAISAAGVLSEPVRRALFEHVAASETPVDRDSAAAATRIGRALAAFHLDRLARAGLLAVEYRRRNGRTGPGAGRPAKFYRPMPGLEIDVSVPARRYRLAAEIFAEGLDRRADEDVRDDVRAAAQARGTAIGAAAIDRPSESGSRDAGASGSGRGRLLAVLEGAGFAPAADGDEIRLRNCPFDPLAAAHRGMTCSMNLALLKGVLTGIGESDFEAVASPRDGSCCVRFVPA